MRPRHRWLITAALTVAVLGGLTAGAAAEEPLHYVALGDSSAAGPLIPNQDPNLACLRSDRNFPQVVADRLGARLTDVTCSGATTDDLAGRRFGFIPPQFDALTPDTDLVTLSMGANDMELGTAIPTCVNLLPPPAGLSCAQRFTAGGKDELKARATATAPKIAAALAEIQRRSPHATVIVTGYGTYTRPGGCWPSVPLYPADADYVQASFGALSDMLRSQSAAAGVTFVDLRDATVGHDMCAAATTRYYEPLVPTNGGVIYHPNARGMAAIAGLVVAAVPTAA
ncbi:SGNH/GDSL hydrolase family protein [Pseudonocardia sp. CA-107938]|uniref:SGNH/GDSL hydrolase family protein n=1 Tax=Pseudonocardia sp. CA-107938 TaxID=3240021 RepID=UPI003D91FCE2